MDLLRVGMIMRYRLGIVGKVNDRWRHGWTRRRLLRKQRRNGEKEKSGYVSDQSD